MNFSWTQLIHCLKKCYITQLQQIAYLHFRYILSKHITIFYMLFGESNVTPWFLYSRIINIKYFPVIPTLFWKFNGCIIKAADVQYFFPLWVRINVDCYTWWLNQFFRFPFLEVFYFECIDPNFLPSRFSIKPNSPSNEYSRPISISTPSINFLTKKIEACQLVGLTPSCLI